MKQSIIISVESSDIKMNGWVRPYGEEQIRNCAVEHAACRVPHIAYRLGYVDVLVNKRTKEGILGIWDWRLPGYYTIPLPRDVCDILHDLYERLSSDSKNKVMSTLSFMVDIPYCKDDHLYKSPLQILNQA